MWDWGCEQSELLGVAMWILLISICSARHEEDAMESKEERTLGKREIRPKNQA